MELMLSQTLLSRWNRLSSVALLAGLVCAWSLYAFPALADDRSDYLVEKFEEFCIQTPPDFDRIDTAATALNLKVTPNKLPTSPVGPTARSKSWSVDDNKNPFALGATAVLRGQNRVIACGIEAPDADGGAIVQSLTAKLKLGEPAADGTSGSSPKKYRTLMWGMP